MTDRVAKLKAMLTDFRPSLSAERAKLATEAIEAHPFEAPVLQKAHMLGHILRNMTIFIQEGELIVGSQTDKLRGAPVFPEFNSEWIIGEIDDFETRKSDPMLLSAEDRATLLEVLPKWKGKSFEQICERELPEHIKHAEESGITTVGQRDCGTGHILPDYWNLLKYGLNHYKAICQKKIDETPVNCRADQEKVDFWRAVILDIEAVGDYALRYSVLAKELAEKEADEVRKAELLEISEICAHVPLKPARTFHEAIQFVWFMHVIVNIESNGHGNSYHRFDQYMFPYYEADIAAGRTTDDRVVELIECFFIKNTTILKLRNKFYSESFAGYPMWQNIIAGGQTPDGKDATNALSHLMLKANADVQTSSPTMSVRWHENLNKDLFEEGLKMIQAGMATPAFFNDNLVVPLIMSKQPCTVEEARNWGIYGCVQPCVAGYSDGRPAVGWLNLLKCLELVLHNGVNPMNGDQLGPKTGDINEIDSLEKLQAALYKQMEYFIDLMVQGYNIVGALQAIRQPMPFASLLINDCVDKGMSLQDGGARYSESGAFAVAIGSAADAVAAIDTIVFKKKLIDMPTLMDALACNFEGKEDIRLMLLNKAPKYGNDDDYVDGIAADMLRYYRSVLERYRDSRDGPYVLVVESQSMNVTQGKCIQASPDGRFAFAPVNDNCSPVMGRDISGPTACVNSVAKLDQMNTQDGCLYNIRFDPRSIQGLKGRQVLESVVITYFKHMGEHIQINVVDDEVLRAAQREPENYRNLLVRVAGYLAYFTELDRDVQDALIARTAHRPD